MKTSLLSRALILATSTLVAACGSRPSPPGVLENVGGSSGREPDAATSGGTSGGGTSGGGASGSAAEPVTDAGHELEGSDAGTDAAVSEGDAGADAGPRVEEGCLIESLDSQCGSGPGCPDLDEAAQWLFDEDAAAVVRRACAGADGTRYISVGAELDDASTGFIYDAESGALASKYVTSDVAELCSEATPSTVGFFGRVVSDCAAVNPNDVTIPCPEGSSGPGNGEDDPDECIYLDE